MEEAEIRSKHGNKMFSDTKCLILLNDSLFSQEEHGFKKVILVNKKT